MTYVCVIPRDLFNEADLLKCYGKLWIELDYLGMTDCLVYENKYQWFQVEQDPFDGSTSIQDISFIVRGEPVKLSRPLNSREPWPLYAEPALPNGEVISVFESDGELTKEMLDFLVPGEDHSDD